VPSPDGTRPVRILVRDLIVAFVVGAALFVLFDLLNHHFFPGTSLTPTDVLLFETGAIVLVAFLLSRAVTGAVNALLAIRGNLSRGHAIRLFLNLIIAAGAVLALFTLAGVSIESIFLGSALAGIVLGLAAQTVLANLFAGLLLVAADPFRPGDRINLLAASLSAIAPSYPHELMYPLFGGTVEDVGLTYTVMRQDSGLLVKVPNSIVLGAVVHRYEGAQRPMRVRMTFPQTIPVATVEKAVADLIASMQDTKPIGTRFSFEVADISATTWDGVVVAYATHLNEAMIRDRILRFVLGRITAPSPAAPAVAST
jgi:small-conductance mechanosensitive channel